MNEVYEQYKEQHPEELQEVNALKDYSAAVERRLSDRRKEKLKRIEKYRRVIYGEAGSDS